MALFDFLKKLFGTDTGSSEPAAPQEASMGEPANESGQPAASAESPADEPTDTPQE
ncbi:hypothetical protein JXA34_03470 [Patescibacteria group bacterium]|nr:hypothetical protein [Patescibacteria group bacterium]